MNRYHVSTLAGRDLMEIYEYIARDNESAAVRMMERFEAVFVMLAVRPLLGELRTDLQPELRLFSVDYYAVFYRPIAGGVQIVRVSHAARDWAKLFS